MDRWILSTKFDCSLLNESNIRGSEYPPAIGNDYANDSVDSIFRIIIWNSLGMITKNDDDSVFVTIIWNSLGMIPR